MESRLEHTNVSAPLLEKTETGHLLNEDGIVRTRAASTAATWAEYFTWYAA